MKKFLFSIILMFGITAFMHAQVIDIVGEGVHGSGVGSITLTDLSTIESVTVNATYKHPYVVSSGPVKFSDLDDTFLAPFEPVTIKKFGTTSLNHKVGFFKSVFNDIDPTINLDVLTNAHEAIYAYYAFIYRDIDAANMYSVIDESHVFMWHNGSADPYVYNLPVNTGFGPRDMTVKVVLAEVNSNVNAPNRLAIIDVDAGGVTAQLIVDDYNLGKFLSIVEIPLYGVPGSATNVSVSIYSPDPVADGELGDSFIAGGVVVDVTDLPNCSYTQGYWKTHSSYGPAGPADETWDKLPNGPDEIFFLSGASWYEVFWTPVKGNKYFSLAHQFMAAHLNFLSGADPTDAQAAYDAAKLLFENYTPAQVEADKKLNKEFGSYVGTLTDYNEGIIGPGHCHDGEEEEFKSAKINTGSEEMLVYPNPMSTNGTIDFRVANNGQTTVEMYNMMGAKVVTLFDRNVQADQKFQVRFDPSEYTGGLYVIYIRNGSSIQKRKITIAN